MSVGLGNLDRSEFLGVTLRPTEPATEKASQFVSSDLEILRMHLANPRGLRSLLDQVVETIDERAKSGFATGRSKGGIAIARTARFRIIYQPPCGR